MSDGDIDEIIRKSEELTQSLSALEELSEESEQQPVDEQVRRENLQSLSREPPETRGYSTLEVSDDQMTVIGHLYPPSGSADGVSMDDVQRQLTYREITFGVDWKAIQSAVWKCNTERMEVHDVVVARGKKPKDEIPEHIGLRKELIAAGKENQARLAEEDRIDYRSLSPFVIVREGDIIARDLPGRKGESGSTVFGEELPYRTSRNKRLKPGRNIQRQDGYYVAGVDGRLEWGETYFRVNEVLELTEGVGYETGHIDFPGDVIIHKPVRDGFHVRAGGSVYCRDTLDASRVICGGNLIARRGIIGRNEAQVEVEGNIEAKYVENCYVEARGSIRVQSGIVNSFVNSLDTVQTGKRGIVVGGKIYATHGVSAGQLGTGMGPKTEIHCGIDYTVSHRLKWIQDKSTEIAFQLQQIKTRIKREPENAGRLDQAKARLNEGLHKLQEAAHKLIMQLDKDDSATVCAAGETHPGVYIEIAHVSFQVNRPLRKKCFSLDKHTGRIVSGAG